MINNKTETEIKALITLLSETKPQNLSAVKRKLLELSPKSRTFLERALNHPNLKIQKEVSLLLEDLRLCDVKTRWINLTSRQLESDLEEGAFLIAGYLYSDSEVSESKRALDHWASDIRNRFKSNKTENTSLKMLFEYFFQKLGFTGNRDHYDDPLNSYLPAVIESRKGLPITLSVIFLLITKRLNLPFVPIGMPGHFIVQYQGLQETFFLDPFNGGKILNRQDCIKNLIDSGYGYREDFLGETRNNAVLSRMLRNLVSVHARNKNDRAVSFMTDLIEILHSS